MKCNTLKRRRACIAILALVLIVAAGVCFAAKKDGGFVDFKLRDLKGKTFHLSEHASEKVIFINFFATYCKPCKKEIPRLVELDREFRDKGLMIIGISVDPAKDLSLLKSFTRSHKITYKTLADTNSRVIRKYNPRCDLPYSILLGKNGKIIARFSGYRPGDEKKYRRKIMDALK